MSPCTTRPEASVKVPISKKKGTFQMWWSPNGMSRRSTNPYRVAAVLGSLTAAQCEKRSMAPCTAGQTNESTTPRPIAASAVTMGTKRFPAKNARY